MKYKKYFRKTSLKQKGIGESFLEEVSRKKPKVFLEIGVFHGVTARNVCELLYKIHKNDFKYVGLDLFGVSEENKNETIPSTSFSNPFKKFYYNIIKRQDPYSFLDGGHHYNTVKNDLTNCIKVILNGGTVLCDDYNLSYAPGVKQAIDEFVNSNKFKRTILYERFVRIEN